MNKLLITLLLAVCSQAEAQFHEGVFRAQQYRYEDQQQQALRDYRTESLALQREALSLQRDALEQQRRQISNDWHAAEEQRTLKRIRCSISYDAGC